MANCGLHTSPLVLHRQPQPRSPTPSPTLSLLAGRLVPPTPPTASGTGCWPAGGGGRRSGWGVCCFGCCSGLWDCGVPSPTTVMLGTRRCAEARGDDLRSRGSLTNITACMRYNEKESTHVLWELWYQNCCGRPLLRQMRAGAVANFGVAVPCNSPLARTRATCRDDQPGNGGCKRPTGGPNAQCNRHTGEACREARVLQAQPVGTKRSRALRARRSRALHGLQASLRPGIAWLGPS